MEVFNSEFSQLAGVAPEKPRLLVVDDQPVNIQVIFQAFSADHQVFMATSGQQALDICRSNPPDLVLLDVVMPGMDGLQVCEQLKADETTRHIPVIFVTAHSDPVEEARGLDVGAVDFIAKPVNPKIVRARVRTHLLLKFQSDLLRQMALLDGLTGVFNRRFFDERLDAECRRAQRSGSPLALVMLDVDFFKRYNDCYGHQGGDDCLRRVSREIKNSVSRAGDFVARYGGEEFACILPATDAEAALEVAQRIERNVRELAIPHEDSDVAPVVTVSMGVAVASGAHEIDAIALLAMADAQLYEAKRTGRARVCLAEMGARSASDAAPQSVARSLPAHL